MAPYHYPNNLCKTKFLNLIFYKNPAGWWNIAMSRYKDFTNLAADIAWETNSDGNITYISGNERFGYKN